MQNPTGYQNQKAGPKFSYFDEALEHFPSSFPAEVNAIKLKGLEKKKIFTPGHVRLEGNAIANEPAR